MKIIYKFILLTAIASFAHLQVNAQEKTEEFKVYGNCSMCEKRIEKAVLSLEGVKTADWDKDTKMLNVNYDQAKLSVDDIHNKVAGAGHDTEKVKAPDEAYNQLPSCCKYRD